MWSDREADQDFLGYSSYVAVLADICTHRELAPLTLGVFDSRKKTLTSTGEEFEPNTKKTMKVRDVLRIISPDEQILEMYRRPAGEKQDYKIMEVRYTRRPEKK